MSAMYSIIKGPLRKTSPGQLTQEIVHYSDLYVKEEEGLEQEPEEELEEDDTSGEYCSTPDVLRKENRDRLSMVEEEETETSETTGHGKIEPMRESLERILLSSGLSYILPANQNKLSTESVYEPDLTFMFKNPRYEDWLDATSKKTLKEKKGKAGDLHSKIPDVNKLELASDQSRANTGTRRQAPPSRTSQNSGSSARRRRSSLMVGPEIKDQLNVYNRTVPDQEFLEKDEKKVYELKHFGYNSDQSLAHLRSKEKLNGIWTWLRSNDDHLNPETYAFYAT